MMRISTTKNKSHAQSSSCSLSDQLAILQLPLVSADLTDRVQDTLNLYYNLIAIVVQGFTATSRINATIKSKQPSPLIVANFDVSMMFLR